MFGIPVDREVCWDSRYCFLRSPIVWCCSCKSRGNLTSAPNGLLPLLQHGIVLSLWATVSVKDLSCASQIISCTFLPGSPITYLPADVCFLSFFVPTIVACGLSHRHQINLVVVVCCVWRANALLV